MPARIGSGAARGWLYVLAENSRVRPVGAIALGHAIITAPQCIRGDSGRLVLAHELSHVRQHDWLGPFYLPLHAVSQILSACLYLLRPRRESTPQHAYNMLEQRFACFPFDALRKAHPPFGGEIAAVLEAFGV